MIPGSNEGTLETLNFISAQQETAAAPPSDAVEAAPDAAPAAGPAEAAPAQAASWESMPLADLLKAKGIDDNGVKLIDFYKQNGSLENFIKAYNTDIDKVSDADLLKMQIDETYGTLSEDERRELLEAKLDQYRTDPDLYSDEQVRRGLVQIKADMLQFRQQQKEKQAALLTTTKASDSAAQTADHANAMAEYNKLLQQSEAYNGLKQKGVLQVGSGDAAFNMDVNLDAAMAYLTDDEAYSKAHLDDKGAPDMRKQLRIAAFATNPDGYEAKLIEHGRKLASIALVKDLGNERPNTEQLTIAEDLTPAQELALKMYGGR